MDNYIMGFTKPIDDCQGEGGNLPPTVVTRTLTKTIIRGDKDMMWINIIINTLD